MHVEYIDKIITSSSNEKMKALEDVLIKTIDYVKQVDKDAYTEIENDLYEIVEGKTLNEAKATEWVSKMEPKAKWNLSEVNLIKQKYKTSVPTIPLYVIMNMLYSDLGDVIGEEMTDEIVDKYVRATEDWYYDSDAKHTEDAKLFNYWKFIAN